MSPLKPDSAFDPIAARARLVASDGPLYWRTLEELAEREDCWLWLRERQPQLHAPLDLDRRGFLQLLGASLALAGLTACGQPPQGQIVPYLRAPVGQVDGLPRYFATTLTRDGYAHGVLVESHMGRPTKIEGNPQHPASLGGTDIFAQAAVLQLWDPDRSQTVMRRDDVAGWDDFDAALLALNQRFKRNGGAGLRVLSGPGSSPTLAALRETLLQQFPRTLWHTTQPGGGDQLLAGAALAFGRPLSTRLHCDRAAVVLALDADFLSDPAAGVRYARDFAARRTPENRNAPSSRLYVVEPTLSLTGAMADHHLPLENARLESFARQLARRLGLDVEADAVVDSGQTRWLDALARDLQAQPGAALIVVGATQPPWLHALGHAMNAALGAAGHTLDYIDPVTEPAGATLAELAQALHAGAVDTLLVLDANPVYDAPADLRFEAALARLPHLLHLGLYRDETGALAEWHLPMAHALESWSDARAFDGTASLAQPLIAPLYHGRTAHEILAQLLGDDVTQARALVRRQWRKPLPEDSEWVAALQSGLIANSALPARGAKLRTDFLKQIPAQSHAGESLEILFRPDPTIGDGRWANNGWLQELPKPLTQLTWDNAALVSPALAASQRLRNGDMVELRLGERVQRAPVWIAPGQAERSVTVYLGYGRRNAGQVGNGLGFDANTLRRAGALWNEGGLQLRPTGERRELAGTQHHFAMEGRALVRAGTLEQYWHAADFAQTEPGDRGPPPSLYPEIPPGDYAWGMSIDLNACIGCKACTIACQAENNIPVVGRDQVLRGREMHWIRVDHYFEGAAANPRAVSQPVPCMMCEHAPCELVCPVGATVHDHDGLNAQVYNRCVGTRFCSNNCPYKVRRFNFLQYADTTTDTFKAQRNPDVTVRQRGVMEKCTYCVQRIATARIEADKDNRRIRDGEVITACQAVCPTAAIHFGDSADPRTQVARTKASPRNYTLLGELNTRPRTTYLARLRNPNPALEGDPT